MVIKSRSEFCEVCYGCVRKCPIKAIKILDEKLEVLDEKCIYCGQCVLACTQEALLLSDEIQAIKKFLADKAKVVAILAPEYIATFYPISFYQLESALKNTGFFAVEETTLAEELIAKEHLRLFSQERTKPLIRSTCPVVVEWIEKYYPELIPSLVPLVSPMIAQGRLVKQLCGPEVITVFIGPCVAQKAEAREKSLSGAIDIVLTFEELKFLLEEQEMQEGAKVKEEKVYLPRRLSFPGGFPREVVTSPSFWEKLCVVRGLENMDLITEIFLEGSSKIIDVLACEGCISGPGMSKNLGLIQRKRIVTEYHQKKLKAASQEMFLRGSVPKLPVIGTSRQFTNKQFSLPTPSETEIREILATGGFFERSEELDCGACGYETCRDHAEAICQGLSSWDACCFFQRMVYQDAIHKFKEASLTDGLTGLMNHRGMKERLDVEVKRAQRYGHLLSLIILDLDNFKPINDSYGHLKGDKVLRKVAEILKSSLRETDICCRYGGDEFLIILPEINKTEAFAVAEKLRSKFINSPLRIDGKEMKITASLGVSSLSSQVNNVKIILEKADQAMYRAKASGGNKICLAPNK